MGPQNDIGDYYLIRCDYFLHERQLFINKYCIQQPSVDKFIKLMQTENSQNIVHLAQFITVILNILKIRENIVNHIIMPLPMKSIYKRLPIHIVYLYNVYFPIIVFFMDNLFVPPLYITAHYPII